MKYLPSISPLLNPSRISQTSRNLHFSRFPQSKIKYSSTFSSHSSSNLYRRPELSIPTNGSLSHTTFARESTSTEGEKKLMPTQRVSAIVDELSSLNLIEVSDLTELLRKKLDVQEMPVMTVMMPGMSFGGKTSGKGGAASKVEEKKEKTAFDLKLEGFDAAAKIKIIKEVRTFTDLGLKEAKDLVEKAPTLLKKGVPKEEAEKIIEKMKEIGAKVVME